MTIRMHRDGADFGSVQGARSGAMGIIVPDEQRCNEPKSARREAVAFRDPLDVVKPFARATSPRCTPFLASGSLKAITVHADGHNPLWGT